ncbi:MAG: DNA polymerase [Sedimenticola sp.]
MIQVGNTAFREVWLVDFEFSAPSGERPRVVCLVAWELSTKRKLRIWEDELLGMAHPPYAIDGDALFVAYYASAEMGCHMALGWSLPVNVLDLFTEFRNATNGLTLPCGAGLLGALTWYGLCGIETAEKESMRELAQRGGPWSESEKQALLDYCESDVAALARLLPKIAPSLDVSRALLRGRYMKAAAHIEHNGIPIDTQTLGRLRNQWESIQDRLIAEIDDDYGVYEGRSFKAVRFAEYLAANDIPWPQLPKGGLDLKDDTFREMARSHPCIASLRELRVALSQMRLSELAVGADGRNRCLLSAFRARTGRNQPSNSKFIFGPAVWMRSLIRAKPGYGIAYIDWSQQEFGIAAALSGDPLMQDAYLSGDPYLAFAKQAGAVPEYATKQSHKAERNQFKACVLAVQYGMGAQSLSQRIGQPVIRAKELLRLHQDTYRVFWTWSNAAVDHAMLHGKLWTVFGWTVHTGSNPNPRFLRNFLMQGNGAEMLRLACCMLIESGIKVCDPVHDAVLIEAPLEDLSEIIRQTQQIMSDASAIVLNGFRLRSDVEIFRYPERYMDGRGDPMWQTVTSILNRMDDD